MRYWIKYLLLLPFFVAMRLSTYPLAPIAVALGTREQLRFPFRWMMTLDNDLGGDEKHKRNTVKDGDPYSFKNKVLWMWRNGGHAAAYGLFGCNRPSNYPQHRSFTPLLGKFLELYLGWSGDEPRGKIVLTMRWRDRSY